MFPKVRQQDGGEAGIYTKIGVHAKEPLSESRAVLLIAALSCILKGSVYGLYVFLS